MHRQPSSWWKAIGGFFGACWRKACKPGPLHLLGPAPLRFRSQSQGDKAEVEGVFYINVYFPQDDRRSLPKPPARAVFRNTESLGLLGKGHYGEKQAEVEAEPENRPEEREKRAEGREHG